jgi:hypothetical protein
LENATLTMTEWDTIRADEMHRWLNEKGCKEIWKYDILRRKQALREAVANDNYDNIETDSDETKSFVLVGPGICDTPFNTVDELKEAVRWLCCEHLGKDRCKTIEELRLDGIPDLPQWVTTPEQLKEWAIKNKTGGKINW